MKFFNWVQNKLNGRKENRKPNGVSANHNNLKEEPKTEGFNNCPHGLLSIGTFGNNDLNKNSEIQNERESPCSSPDFSEFTPEEVGQLQTELTKLLKRKPAAKREEQQNPDLPLDRFLNCPSSLEVSRRISNAVCTDPEYKEDDIERTISVIIGKCKEVRAEKNKMAIGKTSLSFLLKKFVCTCGFSPAPSLRDPLQESRMEKLLRTILRKKIYPQTSRTSAMKGYIEDNKKQLKKREEESSEETARASQGSKWVKTDSEYIVLEI